MKNVSKLVSVALLLSISALSQDVLYNFDKSADFSKYKTYKWMPIKGASTIYTGQLALDMYDSAGHDLVWRGVTSKTIDTNAKPDKQQKNLAKAVKKLVKNYPPTVKS